MTGWNLKCSQNVQILLVYFIGYDRHINIRKNIKIKLLRVYIKYTTMQNRGIPALLIHETTEVLVGHSDQCLVPSQTSQSFKSLGHTSMTISET